MERTQKVVLVTGGAKGIGRGIVLHLAAAGWKVAFCDTDQAAGEQLAANADGEVVFLAGDVASEADVENIVSQTVHWGGGLNAVINNAGMGTGAQLMANDVVEKSISAVCFCCSKTGWSKSIANDTLKPW